jgi:serine protein kinase
MREKSADSLVAKIASLQNVSQYPGAELGGSFEDYLQTVRDNPRVTRTAFQRVYDMILSHGKTEYIDNKKRLVRYHFFSDEKFGARTPSTAWTCR